MTTPTPEILSEFAREVVRSHAQDIKRMSVGEMMADDDRFAGLSEEEFEQAEEAIYDQARGLAEALSWPGELLHDADQPTAATPRLFRLLRDVDHTGVSGPGHVADGVVWPDGTVTLRWGGAHASTVCWASLDDAIAVHGHGGATRFEFVQALSAPARQAQAGPCPCGCPVDGGDMCACGPDPCGCSPEPGCAFCDSPNGPPVAGTTQTVAPVVWMYGTDEHSSEHAYTTLEAAQTEAIWEYDPTLAEEPEYWSWEPCPPQNGRLALRCGDDRTGYTVYPVTVVQQRIAEVDARDTKAER